MFHLSCCQPTRLNTQEVIRNGAGWSQKQGSKTAADFTTVSTLLAALKECSRARDLIRGRKVHSQVVERGLTSNGHVVTSLMSMYAKCGSMDDARNLFNTLRRPDVTCWTALISGYVESEQSELALDLYDALDECEADARVFVAALSACAALAAKHKEDCKRMILAKGRAIHSQVVKNRRQCGNNIFVQNTLVDMYGKLGSMVEARAVFDNMHRRTLVSWNVLLQGYVQNEQCEVALDLFDRMQQDDDEGFAPDARTFVAALSACSALASSSSTSSSSRWLEKGQAIYSRAVNKRCANIFVENTAVAMFAKCGNMLLAQTVFDSMARRDSISWNALLQGYVDNAQHEMAVEMFERSSKSSAGVAGSARSYVAVLTALAALAGRRSGPAERWLEKGKAIHAQALSNRCCDTYVQNTLLDLFGKCGSMVDARSLFDSMVRRDVVSWTALVQGYVENGEAELALELVDAMERVEGGCPPNSRTIAVALSACNALAASKSKQQQQHHHHHQHSKCQWLKEKVKGIHERAVANRCCDNSIHVQNLLVAIYGKCGSMADSRRVFDEMVDRDSASWNGLVLGYVDNGGSEQSLGLISGMNLDGVEMTSVTYVAAVMACGHLMDVERGRAFHEDICSCGLGRNVVVMNCVVDLYGKCGRMRNARAVFDSMEKKTVVSWTSLMCGYGLQGDATCVFEVFEEMKEQGVAPNHVTFVCLLAVCSHAGLTQAAKECFAAMHTEYGVLPGMKHYVCMVDLLGRATCVDEAVRLVRGMPPSVELDAVTWKAVLAAAAAASNACHHAQVAYEALLELDEKDASAYVMYANAT